jgi:hypothetical protein
MEISYKGFCALGGLTNPRLFSRAMRNGTHVYIKYYLV